MPEIDHGRLVAVALPPRAPEVQIPPVRQDAVTVLPVPGPRGAPGSSGAGYEHWQQTPVSVWTINHGLNRDVVAATVYSLDLTIEWDNVLVQSLGKNTTRLSFDDPTSGVALIL